MEQDTQSDAVLVQQVQAGQQKAFDLLVAKYQRRIYRLVLRFIRDPALAEDVAQETFLRAYRAIGQFRGDSQFYTWLYRIAVNLALNFIKQRKRRAGAGTLSLDDIDTAAERDPDYLERAGRHTPDQSAHWSEVQRRIHEALGTLTEKHRAVVVMHDLQGLPHDEVARILRIPTATVRTRLFYARKQLQGELRELMES